MADNDQDQPSPATAALTGRLTAQVNAGGTFRINATDTADAELVRAPFSEPGIAERLTADPEFYRRLAAHVALELRAYADSIDTQGQANVSHVIKGRVTEIADGFDETASALTTHNGILAPTAAQKVAATVSRIRDAYASLCTEHPEVLRLAAIGLAGVALHLLGHASGDVTLLISYAVIQRERLSDIIGRKDKKDE